MTVSSAGERYGRRYTATVGTPSARRTQIGRTVPYRLPDQAAVAVEVPLVDHDRELALRDPAEASLVGRRIIGLAPHGIPRVNAIIPQGVELIELIESKETCSCERARAGSIVGY
jgi:hypothetical protein